MVSASSLCDLSHRTKSCTSWLWRWFCFSHTMWPTTQLLFPFNLGGVWKSKCKCREESCDRGLSVSAAGLVARGRFTLGVMEVVSLRLLTAAQQPRTSDVASTVQLFYVTACVEAAGLSWLEEKARKQAMKQVLSASSLELNCMPSSALLCSEAKGHGGNFSHFVYT